MESSHATAPQQTPHGPQHHLIVASSPSFESDGSNFDHTDDDKENILEIDTAKHSEKLPSPSNNNRSRIVSPIRSNYLSELQAEINSLQQDVLGMQESILLLSRDMKKARVASIRNMMVSKYGHHVHTDTSVSSETTAVSGLDDIDALIAECLKSIHEEEEEESNSQSKIRASGSHSSQQVIKSMDRKMVEQKERESGVRNQYQQRRKERQREEQSPSHSMTPITTPRRQDRTIVTPLESIQTPSPFPQCDDGHQHVKRNLFLAGNTPGVKIKRKDWQEATTRDDRIHRVLILLILLLAAAFVWNSDASVQSNRTRPPRRPRRSRLSEKKFTIDMQLNSCGKCDQGTITHYNPKQPHFIQELGVWRSYREGRARLEPWRAIVLSLRGRSSLDPAEGTHLVSEYTFWL